MGLFDAIGGYYKNVYTLGLFNGGPSGTGSQIPGGPTNYLDTSKMSGSASALQNTLNGLPAPKDISAYQAKDMSSTPLPQYDTARNIESQSLNSAQQSESDAMQRRFAGMGNLNSGAYIKSAQIADQKANENRANAISGINMQEANTRTGLQQNEANKEFQSGESTKQFNAGQGNQYRQFQAENASKVAQLDLAYKSSEQQAADDQYQAAMNAYQARHSGGLLGAGGFLGSGIGV